MTLVRLILLLGICVTGFVAIESVDCNNGAGYCNFYSYYLRCYITNNDTELIKVLLRVCSSRRSSFINTQVYKYYVSNEYSNLLIDIELPSNIKYLYISNSKDQDHIRLTTFTDNTALTRIYISSYIELESNDFFNHFTGLQTIEFSYVLSREPPSFTNLYSLTYLRMHLVGPVTHTFDGTMLEGTSNMVVINLANSYFNGITKGAFHNLNKLTNLDFGNNQLNYIEDDALTELSSLERLDLYNNEIQTVSENIFQGLTDLTYLRLDYIPGFLINALIHTRSLYNLLLRYNGYHTLDPYVFQQMDSLRYLYLSDPFVCDCRLQWASLVKQYGVYIQSGVCSESIGHFPKSITEQTLYTNYSQTESFQCFNKSITCPGNQVCHNTEDSYFCGCPRGYALRSSGQCNDIDECDEATDCQHTCQNTKGSFNCVCNEGYELSSDGYSCNDVNECQEWNGGCEFGCRNTIGSYQCYCEYGHQLYDDTSCLSDIECEIVDSIESQNSDQLERRFTCDGGFNLSVSNLTCLNLQTTTTEIQSEGSSGGIISISLLFVIAVIIIVIQVIAIIAIVILFLHKIKSIKANRNIVVKEPAEPQPKQSMKGDSEEQTYYDISELPSKANPVQVPKSRYQDVSTKKYSKLPKVEPYPSEMQDSLKEYANLK